MARIVLSVLGVLLALFVVFGILIPAVVGILKLLFVIAVIGFVVVAGVTLVGRLSK
ncbi:hypothetical protein [Sphaerisporangium corydalis]|uniref:DUF1328 domain-containing protein n=1 Tax=Sphaerisporangium corydalis TaxID=1441875 RepID=A0ABV9EGB7_9ACTN|nr:hypothetical protein [Sphaerisporangium corydalis]